MESTKQSAEQGHGPFRVERDNIVCGDDFAFGCEKPHWARFWCRELNRAHAAGVLAGAAAERERLAAVVEALKAIKNSAEVALEVETGKRFPGQGGQGMDAGDILDRCDAALAAAEGGAK